MSAMARLFFAALAVSFACLAESPAVRGKLTQREGQTPAIETPDHKFISMQGDVPTMGVLQDKRLAGADLEAHGTLSVDTLAVDPIHTKALFVHKAGKRLLITYWCDVCSIRTYTPGLCWCCQEETHLDLREQEKE